ncbi:MAG: ComEC/Rec2 family competence protein [Verrucomicrobia bacterium]|nr:ComEC/Rec2 family competence protein [Verrucomicrobiota bacterium]MBV8486021.1 ComEC/Rec2 family competence protein [Verrucomicrobiota bacterium]
MRRIPLGGLFLAACLGVAVAEVCPIPFLGWGIAFGLSAIAVAAWRRTAFALAATLLFFGFWHSFRRGSDQGYQLVAKSDLASRIHQIDLEAEADSKPFHWGNQIKQRLIAKVTSVDGRPMDFRVEAELASQPIHYGDRCQVMGRLEAPQRALNPGEFDERTYLRHEGIYVVLNSANARDATIKQHSWGNPIFAIALSCRKAVENIPTRSLENDHPIKALIEGVTFGDRSDFDPDLLELLQDTGTLHLFVIDGLKVTLLAGISWIAARLFCLPRRWIAGAVVPLLLLYCAGTGLSAAGLRATLMALFVLVGISLERPVLQLNAMSGAGFILLLCNPEELFQLGFQLSFAIVAFIVIGARPLTSWLAHPFKPDPWIPRQLISRLHQLSQRLIHRSAELLAVCTICWVSSLPFSIFYFHRISFSNVVANFLAVPVGTWILFTALVSILVSPIAGWASIYLNNANWLLAHVFLVIVNASAAFPGQAMNIGRLPWLAEVKIVVLASGRSETIYFCRGPHTALVNPGSPSKYRRITEPFLRSEGVNGLSFLNWTRSDQDHAGSASEVIKHFKVAGISSESLSSRSPAAAGKEEEVSSPIGITKETTSRMSLGEEKISLNDEIAWSGTKFIPPLKPVLDCQLGSFVVLLLNSNRQQIEVLPSRTVDVVVVPSQRQCSSPELLRKFHPQAILYLQGKPAGNQSAGGPAVPIWFLGDKGAVTIALSNKDLELSGYLGDRLTLRSRNR